LQSEKEKGRGVSFNEMLMKPIEIDKELEQLKALRPRSYAKLTSKLKKQLDIRMEHILHQKGYVNFKLSYFPFLMNIDLEGITNNDLSKRFGVTKQATSKMLNELTDLKYITTEPHGDDGRSSIVFLTERGKKFVIEAKHCMEKLTNEYRVLLGKREYETMIDMMMKISDYNERQPLPQIL
jgi:DNA-binding MarR family transcriptional regulator